MGEKHMQTLKARMRSRGIRQSEMAELLGINPASLSLWLNGHRTMSAEFHRRAEACVDLIARADRAALLARQKVLDSAVDL